MRQVGELVRRCRRRSRCGRPHPHARSLRASWSSQSAGNHRALADRRLTAAEFVGEPLAVQDAEVHLPDFGHVVGAAFFGILSRLIKPHHERPHRASVALGQMSPIRQITDGKGHVKVLGDPPRRFGGPRAVPVRVADDLDASSRCDIVVKESHGPNGSGLGYGLGMSVSASVRGHGCCFTLRVDRYESPNLTTGSDANWLAGTVDLEVGLTGTFRVRKQLSPFAPDLKAFRDELRALDRDLTGRATLAHLEDEFELTITLENGKGVLAGRVREHIGASLAFDQIETDQTYVREALEQFDALVTAFPVRGNPAD